jgi:transcriptional regulator with XRE-family HTH domain
MKFGKWLREARERRKLTQDGLAERSGIPVSSIRSWEQGQRLPSLTAAASLARALEVTLDELARCDEIAPSPAPARRPRKPK